MYFSYRIYVYVKKLNQTFWILKIFWPNIPCRRKNWCQQSSQPGQGKFALKRCLNNYYTHSTLSFFTGARITKHSLSFGEVHSHKKLNQNELEWTFWGWRKTSCSEPKRCETLKLAVNNAKFVYSFFLICCVVRDAFDGFCQNWLKMNLWFFTKIKNTLKIMIMKSLVRQFFKWIIKTRQHAVWATMLCKWLLKILNFNKHTFRNKITKLHHWPKHANAHTLHHFAIRLWKFLFPRYLPKTKKLLKRRRQPASQPKW